MLNCWTFSLSTKRYVRNYLSMNSWLCLTPLCDSVGFKRQIWSAWLCGVTERNLCVCSWARYEWRFPVGRWRATICSVLMPSRTCVWTRRSRRGFVPSVTVMQTTASSSSTRESSSCLHCSLLRIQSADLWSGGWVQDQQSWIHDLQDPAVNSEHINTLLTGVWSLELCILSCFTRQQLLRYRSGMLSSIQPCRVLVITLTTCSCTVEPSHKVAKCPPFVVLEKRRLLIDYRLSWKSLAFNCSESFLGHSSGQYGWHAKLILTESSSDNWKRPPECSHVTWLWTGLRDVCVMYWVLFGCQSNLLQESAGSHCWHSEFWAVETQLQLQLSNCSHLRRLRHIWRMLTMESAATLVHAFLTSCGQCQCQM